MIHLVIDNTRPEFNWTMRPNTLAKVLDDAQWEDDWRKAARAVEDWAGMQSPLELRHNFFNRKAQGQSVREWWLLRMMKERREALVAYASLLNSRKPLVSQVSA